jgi:hypothetical protein
MIDELYSRFLDEEPVPAIAEVVEDLSEFIFSRLVNFINSQWHKIILEQ